VLSVELDGSRQDLDNQYVSFAQSYMSLRKLIFDCTIAQSPELTPSAGIRTTLVKHILDERVPLVHKRLKLGFRTHVEFNNWTELKHNIIGEVVEFLTDGRVGGVVLENDEKTHLICVCSERKLSFRLSEQSILPSRCKESYLQSDSMTLFEICCCPHIVKTPVHRRSNLTNK